MSPLKKKKKFAKGTSRYLHQNKGEMGLCEAEGLLDSLCEMNIDIKPCFLNSSTLAKEVN